MTEEEKQPLTQYAEPPPYSPPPSAPPLQGHAPSAVPYQGAPPPQGQPQMAPTYHGAPPPQSQPPMAPPPQGQPPPVATHTTIITRQPVVATQVKLGEYPVTVTCPTGNHQVTTNVEYTSGNLTYLIAAVLCFFFGPCIAIIPFFINDLKDVVHRCPVDGTVIGTYKRM